MARQPLAPPTPVRPSGDLRGSYILDTVDGDGNPFRQLVVDVRGPDGGTATVSDKAYREIYAVEGFVIIDEDGATVEQHDQPGGRRRAPIGTKEPA